MQTCHKGSQLVMQSFEKMFITIYHNKLEFQNQKNLSVEGNIYWKF